MVRYRRFDYAVDGDLTGGDIGTRDVETLAAPFVGDLDVLRTSHHGSQSGTNQALLDRCLPGVAIVSSGQDNLFGHSHDLVLGRLIEAPPVAAIWATNHGATSVSPNQIEVGSTDGPDGGITIETDGLASFSVNGVSYPTIADATAPATAMAGGPYAGTVGKAVSFAGAGSDPSPTDADSLAFAWSFGDGAQAVGTSVTHTFATPGPWPVTLVVTDADGATASATTAAHEDRLGLRGHGAGLVVMAKKTDPKITLNQDFEFQKDADLNAAIATFVAEHANKSGQRLAMDARRSLGPGKVRITFRVVSQR